MAFRLSQKAFGQLLRSQTRTLATSSAARTAARSAVVAPCSRVASAKSFSTSRASWNVAAEPSTQAAPEASQSAAAPAQERSSTVFFANLPFFVDQAAFEQLLQEFGAIENVRWSTTKSKAPIVHVTFQNAEDAAALVESSQQEPFFFGGRNLRVDIHTPRPPGPLAFPPSNRIYFTQFEGDLIKLRNWLGDHALYVNHAYFATDKITGAPRNSGIISFTDVEHAKSVISELKNKEGPDGNPVYLRFARTMTAEEAGRRRASSEN